MAVKVKVPNATALKVHPEAAHIVVRDGVLHVEGPSDGGGYRDTIALYAPDHWSRAVVDDPDSD